MLPQDYAFVVMNLFFFFFNGLLWTFNSMVSCDFSQILPLEATYHASRMQDSSLGWVYFQHIRECTVF